MKFIHLPTFIVSLALGLFLVYISQENVRAIFVYPTPDNVGSIQYVDNANNCYEFEKIRVKCPSNNNVVDYSVQT